MTYSDTVSAMLSMLIRYYRQLSLYTINSLLYCGNISFFSSGWYTFRASSRLLIYLLIPYKKPLHSFLLEPKYRKKKQCHIPDAASERV